MSVYQKLNEARARFHELQLKKTGHNKFANYKYFELGDFLIPALGVFREVGLIAVVSFDADMACMTIRDVESPAETIVITSPMGSAALKGCHEVQNIGAVETYQRRYLWVAALEIVEHDALDSVTGSDKGEPMKAHPSDGARESLSADQADKIDKDAVIVGEFMDQDDASGAWDFIERQGYSGDEKIALWSLLDSKVRSALKKAQRKGSA